MGETGFSQWSRRVESKLTDIFALQAEIARIVSNALSVRMATDDPAPGGTRNVAAYEAYLQGKALYNQAKDEATDRQAKALYENAIATDPEIRARPRRLSRVLSSIASAHAAAEEIKPTFAAAIAAGRVAVALAPQLAEAHLALGYALFAGRFDIKGARPSYDSPTAMGAAMPTICCFTRSTRCARGARARPRRRSTAGGRARPAQPAHPPGGRNDRLRDARL